MAAAPKTSGRLVRFLRAFSGASAPDPEDRHRVDLTMTGGQSISRSEKAELAKKLTAISTPRQPQNSYNRYIQPTMLSIARMKFDNEAMRVLAPEVAAAQTLVIPSIMSPTNLRDGEITIKSTSKLVDTEVNQKISQVLDMHFNKHLKLSTKLPGWIQEALYGAGAKPLLVLPISELDIIINDPAAIAYTTTTTSYPSGANEALAILNNIDRLDDISLFGIADSAHKKKKPTDSKTISSEAVESLRPAMESAVARLIEDMEPKPKDNGSTSYNLDNELKSGSLKPALAAFYAEAIESVNIVDNPDALKVGKLKDFQKSIKLKQKIVEHYKFKPLITVNPEKGPSKGDPVVYELPPECVVPIFTPGSPADHIGYFIAIDEFGNPVSIDQQDDQIVDMTDSRRTNPAALYKSFGVENHFTFRHGSSTKREQAVLLQSVYQTIIEGHLTGRLKDSGLDNVYIGTNENVYRCLFARYLQARKTKLLFVPKDFLTYFCFRHNADGTGRSKLEDVKFILSLKVTLIVCRMMAMMNAAINRRKITIQFDEKMGDPIQYLQQVAKEAVDKQVMNFTYDPSDITRTLAMRAITISAKGIPGAESFNVENEPNEMRSIIPDDKLFEDINNMLVLALDVPAATMNLLNENEFSRSVATGNIMFSQRISAYQKTVCTCVAAHVRMYTNMSETLKKSIRDILGGGTDEEKKAVADPGTVDDKTEKKISIEDTITDILNSIECTLPEPIIAPNKTEFEELDTMIASLTTALDAVFDNDLASADANPMVMIRALIRSDIVRSYMHKIGASHEIELQDFTDVGFQKQILDVKQALLNIAKGISDTSSKLQAVPIDDSLGGGTDGGFDTPPEDNTGTGGAPPDDNMTF